MLIKQIVDFELGGPGPLGIHALLKVVIFMTKQNLQDKSSSELLFTAKNIAGGYVSCFSSLGPSQLQNLTPKFKILNVLWT